MLRVKCWWAAFALLLGVLLAPCAARAQSAPAEIEVRVTDAAGKPLANARVYVNGPLSTSALTPSDGTIRFTSVEPGLYRLRVALAGYNAVDADEVEALAGLRKIVEITLTRTLPRPAGPQPSPAPGGLQEIGRVQARAPVNVSAVSVDEGNPIRRISENLADALDKLAGVTVDQALQGNTLTISLRGADPSQTATSIGGAGVVGAASGTLQAVAADLSSGVSADSGSSIGAIGGAVNFNTLQPTRTWQAQLSGSYGGYERSSAQLSLSGSYHKLGIALQHATRGGDSVLTGLRFTDTSGETYVHDGAFDRLGDIVKLRYPLGHVTLTAQYLAATTRNAPLCDQWVTVLPCGYGPGGSIRNRAVLGNVLFQGQVGNVTVQGAVVRNWFHQHDDEPGRVVAGIPSPYRLDGNQSVTGFSDYSTIAVHRHTFLLNVGSYSGSGTTVTTGRFQGVAPSVVRQAYTVLGDTLKFSDRLSATLAYGSNVSLVQSQSAADLTVQLTPSRQETLTFGSGIYGGGTGQRSAGFFSDPAAATYNCAGDSVLVTGPNDPPQPGLLNSTSLSYQRRGRRGSLNVGAYDRLSRGGILNAQFPLASLGPGAVPPGYLDTVGAFWHEPAICGGAPFDPARVYVAAAVSGATVHYRGVDASGQLVLGRSVIALPSYSVSSAALASDDPRLTGPGSGYAVGAQLPFRPLHRAGLLLDAIQRKAALEYVVNGTWTSGNNPAGLGSYVIVSAGASWTARRGRLSLFVNNLFNADTGLFGRTEFAQPLALRGGGTYLPVPTLLQPRTFTILYSARIEPPPPPRPPAPRPPAGGGR
jgi:Carboxypeptidase regulatory-like domain